MILYFNKNGQLLEQLEYGAKPRVGMTTFQIFAYFEGIDLDNYGAALIRFKRPDLQGSEYPNLFMKRVQINYHANIESSGYYKEINNPYDGYIFNFNTVRDDDTNAIVQMLDTPGIWEASITLVNSGNGRNVTGLIRFTVGGAVSDADEDMTILSEAVIENNVISAIASKVDQNSLYYARIVDNLAESVADHDVFLKTVFKVNAVVYDKTTNSCYTITAVTPVDENGDADEDGDYVTIDAYQKIEGVLPSVSISNSATLQDLFNKLNLAYGTGQTQKVAFILNNAYLGYAETFGGVLVNFHFLSLSSNLSYSKVVEETSLNSITVGEVFTIANTTIIFDNRSNLIPKEDNYYNLGANDKKWAHAYISEINGVDNIYDSNNNSYLRSGRSLLGMGADLDLDLGSATYYWNNVYAQHWIDKDGNDWHVEDGNPYFNSHKIVVDTDLNDYATVAYVNEKVIAVYRYKGSVPTYVDLPSSDLTIGDVYNVEDSGDNYAWTGTEWDRLGGNISVDNMMTTDTSQIVTGQKEFRYDMSGGLTNHTRTIIDGWGIEMQRFSDAAYTTPQGKLLKFGATYEHVDPFITFGSYTIEFPEKSGRLVVDTDNANVLKSGTSTDKYIFLSADGSGGTEWKRALPIVNLNLYSPTIGEYPHMCFFDWSNDLLLLNWYGTYRQDIDVYLSGVKGYWFRSGDIGGLTFNDIMQDAYFHEYAQKDSVVSYYKNVNKSSLINNYNDENKPTIISFTDSSHYLFGFHYLTPTETVIHASSLDSDLEYSYRGNISSLTFTNFFVSTNAHTKVTTNSNANVLKSGSATAGQALTADGDGGTTWSDIPPSGIQEISIQGTDTFAQIKEKAGGLNFFGFEHPFGGGRHYAIIDNINSQFIVLYKNGYSTGAYSDSMTYTTWNTNASFVRYLTNDSDLAGQVNSGSAEAGLALESDGSNGAEWSKKLPYANMSQQGSATLAELPIERPFLMYFTNQYVNGYFWGRIESLGNSYAFYFEAVQGHGIYKSSSTVAGTTTLDSIFTGPSSSYYVAPVKKTYLHELTITEGSSYWKLQLVNTKSSQYQISDFYTTDTNGKVVEYSDLISARMIEFYDGSSTMNTILIKISFATTSSNKHTTITYIRGTSLTYYTKDMSSSTTISDVVSEL